MSKTKQTVEALSESLFRQHGLLYDVIAVNPEDDTGIDPSEVVYVCIGRHDEERHEFLKTELIGEERNARRELLRA